MEAEALYHTRVVARQGPRAPESQERCKATEEPKAALPRGRQGPALGEELAEGSRRKPRQPARGPRKAANNRPPTRRRQPRGQTGPKAESTCSAQAPSEWPRTWQHGPESPRPDPHSDAHSAPQCPPPAPMDPSHCHPSALLPTPTSLHLSLSMALSHKALHHSSALPRPLTPSALAPHHLLHDPHQYGARWLVC